MDNWAAVGAGRSAWDSRLPISAGPAQPVGFMARLGWAVKRRPTLPLQPETARLMLRRTVFCDGAASAAFCEEAAADAVLSW